MLMLLWILEILVFFKLKVLIIVVLSEELAKFKHFSSYKSTINPNLIKKRKNIYIYQLLKVYIKIRNTVIKFGDVEIKNKIFTNIKDLFQQEIQILIK